MHCLTKKKGDFLLIEDGTGEAKNYYAQDFENILNTMKNPPELVLLMACHSEEIGRKFIEAGSSHVICVLKDWPIDDNACVLFTDVFYSFFLS